MSFPASTASAPPVATGPAIGASKAPSCSSTVSPSTARTSGWSSGQTYRAFAAMLASSTEESDVRDPWVTRMSSLPATVVSNTLKGPLDCLTVTVVHGDAVDVGAVLRRVYATLAQSGRLVFSVEHPIITSSDQAWKGREP